MNIEAMFSGLTEETHNVLTQYKDELSSAISKISGISSIAPIPANIFAAFRECPIEETRVCIIGQDPFPDSNNGVPYANGLSFSTDRAAPIQRSTKMIYNNLIHTAEITDMPKHGDLTAWAKQGVLLFNTILTTEIGKSAAHKDIWLPYTKKIVDELKKRGVIFICFGTYAKNLVGKGATIFSWGHPSPSNRDNNGDTPKHFKYNPTFKQANEELIKRGKSAIVWNPDYVIDSMPIVRAIQEASPIAHALQESAPITIPNNTLYAANEGVNDEIIHVFTDGAATKNGRENCRASYAYYITGSSVDVRHADFVPPTTIEGEKYSSSNNRGELSAIMSALAFLAAEIDVIMAKNVVRRVIVVSDSEYAINCITKWAPNWFKNPEKHSLNEKKNLDLIRPAIDSLTTLKESVSVSFQHIRSHKKAPANRNSEEWFLWNGNDIADKLCSKLLQ